MPPRSPRASRSISFRLSGALLDRLAQLAADGNLSLGDAARQLLTSALQDEDRLRTLEELGRLRHDVEGLRTDLASSIEMVLLNLPGGANPDEVREWVTNNLRR